MVKGLLMSVNPEESGSPTIRDELLFLCLERVSKEGRGALEAMCAEHPNHAQQLREGFQRLDAMGLVDSKSAGTPASFPEQLGEFRLIRKIGGGGMGVVYLAQQGTQACRVALKVIRPDRIYDSKDVARFRREVEAIARLEHPGIVSVISVGQDREIPFFVMEWLEGSTLHDVLGCFEGRQPEALTGEDLFKAILDLQARSSGAKDEVSPVELPALFEGTWSEACIRITQAVARALDHSHDRGIVHRDIKPSNIWVTPAGRTVLIDFGLARSSDATQLTRTGTQVGSLLYMSPEQVRGSTATDKRTDIYSLGVTLYKSLTLRDPFESGSNEGTMQRIIAGDVRTPRTWNPAIPRNAQMVCLTAMSREPDSRYSGAVDFSRDLANVLAGMPVVATGPGWSARARIFSRRHPIVVLSLALFSLLLFFAVFTAARERVALQRIQLLADSHWIAKMTREAWSFWPMDPGRLEEMGNWYGKVDQVRKRYSIYQRELTSIRENALPYTEEEERMDRAPDEERIAGLRKELRSLEDLMERADDPEAFNIYNDAELVNLKRLIDKLSTKDHRRTWTFGTRSEEWRHAMLTRLIETEYRELLDLEKKVLAHEQGIRFAHKTSMLDPAAEWDRAKREISELEVYRGLKIEPQMGLFPLRRNSESGLWEFVHVISGAIPGAEPTPDDPCRLEIDAETGIVMVLLPGGVVEVGTRSTGVPFEEPIPALDLDQEQPAHSVLLDPFFVSKYELTGAQFVRLGGTLLPSQSHSALPILSNRIALLKVLDRTWLQLPSEAQWEYACRAGTTTAFYTGNSIASLENHANVWDRSVGQEESPVFGKPSQQIDDRFRGNAPVGSFLPNPFGLYDMHGNARELAADVFIRRAYTTMEARPGDGLRYFARDWEEGHRYPIRGGGSTDTPIKCRSAARAGVLDNARWGRPGVRVIRRVRP